MIERKNYLGEIKEWYGAISLPDLIMMLQFHCPNYGAEQPYRDRIPSRLLAEAEGEERRNNTSLLQQFLNEIMFKDPDVVSSTGMRQYFLSFAGENSDLTK